MTEQEPCPAGSPVRRTDEVLAWCGKDRGRLHAAYERHVMNTPVPRQHQSLTAALSARLGWPLPDTPPAEVLRGAGTPGVPLARVLAAEESRPERLQRPELVAELRHRVAAAGPWATSVDPRRRAP